MRSRIALGRGTIPLPGMGLFCLDPATVVPAGSGSLPAMPRLASAAVSFPVDSGVQGITLYWQAVPLDPNAGRIRVLTNCVETRFP